jgi:L-lactate permease/lactate permease
MPTWTQIYDPLDQFWASAAIAALPILVFFVTLALLRMKGHIAATLTVATALAVAILFYGMPASTALAAMIDGFLFGEWPIAWIIVSAVFLYKLTVKSGQFEIIRASVTSITEDQRLQMLMVGFCFGAFLEGAAGFGTPVAITAAMLVGLGFNPLYAAGLCLIANTAPVAFGALGTPIIVAGQIGGIDANIIGAMAGRQLPFLSLFVPFWIIGLMDGMKGIRQTWPAILVAGGTFAICQYLVSNYLGPQLPDIISALASLIAVTLFLKVWEPKEIFRFQSATLSAARTSHSYSGGQVLKAWSPFLILTVLVTIWTLKDFKDLFAKTGPLAGINFNISVPMLDKLVIKAPPIVAAATPYAAVYNFSPLAASGTAILISALLSCLVLRIKPGDALKTFGETFVELRWPIYTIGMVLAFAYIANYSGASSTLALALAGTGAAYPFFAPILGWLGVFLTGSDTSSNALFCGLQANTAHALGQSDVLMVAANTTGGVTGKMISPQSIAVACAAAGMVGQESEMFRFTYKHSLFFVFLIGLLTMLQAYVLPWMIPVVVK